MFLCVSFCFINIYVWNLIWKNNNNELRSFCTNSAWRSRRAKGNLWTSCFAGILWQTLRYVIACSQWKKHSHSLYVCTARNTVAFAKNPSSCQWTVFDDSTVRELSTDFRSVITTAARSRLQPLLLFYELVQQWKKRVVVNQYCVGRRRNRRQYGDIALAATMRQRQMRITMCCFAKLIVILKMRGSCVLDIVGVWCRCVCSPSDRNQNEGYFFIVSRTRSSCCRTSCRAVFVAWARTNYTTLTLAPLDRPWPDEFPCAVKAEVNQSKHTCTKKKE